MWPQPIDDPREVERAPTFHRGHAWGTAPRTRVRVWAGAGSSPYWSMLDRGIVCQSDDEGDTLGFYLRQDYQSRFEWEGDTHRAWVQVIMSDYPLPSVGQFTITNETAGGTTFWRREFGPETIFSGRYTMELFSNQLEPSPPNVVLIDPVFDWSRPTERWPGSVIGEPVT